MRAQRLIRKARLEDFPAIYKLQNVPVRDQAFDTPLAPYDYFQEDLAKKINSGEEIYYVMEDCATGSILAFLWFQKWGDDIIGNFWGRWIKTLFLVAGKIAFELLGFKKIYFTVRKDNERVVEYYEKMGVRKVGEKQGIYVRENDMILATANIYEVLEDEYWRMVPPATTQALDLTYVND
jgi:ribosomal protein S18 acetylase RimI-like enzyme